MKKHQPLKPQTSNLHAGRMRRNYYGPLIHWRGRGECCHPHVTHFTRRSLIVGQMRGWHGIYLPPRPPRPPAAASRAPFPIFVGLSCHEAHVFVRTRIVVLPQSARS